MNARLLTLDNLYEYYSTHKRSYTFNYEKTGAPIVVQLPATIDFAKEENISEGLTAVRLQACHTNKNLNSSSISKEVMEEKFLPTFKNRPILGYIREVDGQAEFAGHEMHIDEENDSIVYDEICVGIIPESNNAELVYDEDKDRYNVFVDGWLFDEYTQAREILERKKQCSVSVELSLKKFSYDAADKSLVIEDGFFSGVTILGVHDDGSEVLPGMEGSNIKFKDFSLENNSMFTEFEESKLIETLDKLNATLSNFEINTTRKEDKLVKDENFEVTEDEVTEKVIEEIATEDEVETTEETPEDVVFEEDSEEDKTKEEPESEDENETESEEEDDTEVKKITEEEAEEEESEDTPEEDVTEDEEPEEDVPTDDEQEHKVTYEVTLGETTKTFELSLNEKIAAVQTLVNETYAEDDDWYCVDVYEETQTVIMHGWYKSYRQNYEVADDVYSLVGERVEVHPVFMTDDEEKAFDEMKANFEVNESKLQEVSEKLAKYEAEPEKLAVLESAEYSQIADTEEFVELKKRETYFNMSVEEITNKCDEMLLSYAKSNTLNFAKEEVKKESEKKPTMFAFAKMTSKSDFLDGLLNK